MARPPSLWTWDTTARRYRRLDGRSVSEAELRTLRDRFLALRSSELSTLSARLSSGALSLNAWELEMRAFIKQTWSTEYQLGRGGRAQMKASDWGRVGSLVKRQYAYLGGFVRDLAAELLSPAQAAARAELYSASAVHGYELGQAAAWGLRLPGYPGDGRTACLVRCRCSWSIKETRREWRATWHLGSAEHCRGCLRRRSRWNPYRVPKARPARILELRAYRPKPAREVPHAVVAL